MGLSGSACWPGSVGSALSPPGSRRWSSVPSPQSRATSASLSKERAKVYSPAAAIDGRRVTSRLLTLEVQTSDNQ